MDAAGEHSPLERSKLVLVTGWFVVAAGVGVAMLRFFGEVPPGQNLESATGALALGAVIAAPGILALLARDGRPELLLPAAVLLIPLSFISFALVTLPLLIPSFLLFRAYARSAPTGSGWRAAAVTIVVLALLVVACVTLFVHPDPREFASDTTTYGTSDIITFAEAAASLTLTAAAIAVGWLLSGQRAAPAPSSRQPTVLAG